MTGRCFCLLWFLIGGVFPFAVFAGGSGLNVAVVVNQASSNSVALGNYYVEGRQVPPQNVLRITWTGGNTDWTLADFEQYLATPLRNMLTERGLNKQIEFVLLSMDIPYRVQSGTSYNSTTSTLFYGFKSDLPQGSCTLPSTATNPYAATEGIFRLLPSAPTFTNALLTTMITASNLADAKLTVDQGVAGDSTFPTQPVMLAKSTDRLRNIRYLQFDNAEFESRLLGLNKLVRTNCSNPAELGYIGGYQNGMGGFQLGETRFVPGAVADDLTSFGGRLFVPNDQTTLLAFLCAGASGSYGTVVEPCAHKEKFPSPMVFFYQARGFSLAEAYYQSVSHPYQGLMVGEPLTSPFSMPVSGDWLGLTEGTTIQGNANLSLSFISDQNRPIQQVDLFVDGMFYRTLTNVPPQSGNMVRVNAAGRIISYRVPSGATLQTVASGLAVAIENQRTMTGVTAGAVGDRVWLQSVIEGRSGSSVALAANSTAGTANAVTTFIQASGTSFQNTIAQGLRSMSITNTPRVGDWLQLVVVKTNGMTVAVGVTNAIAGTTLADFTRLLLETVVSHPSLEGPDGIQIQDVNMHEDYPWNVYVYGTNDHSGTFNIRAAAPGWSEAKIRVCFRGSARFRIQPTGTNSLEQNIDDLRPRAHLYVSAGQKNLPVQFSLATGMLADGYHCLAAVAYEGVHARTQTRISRNVQIRNSSLSADLTLLSGASNTLATVPIILFVKANATQVSKIELFSTGGSLQSSSGVAESTFTVNPGVLGAGLHPFYAMVTSSGGAQYRTAAIWVRIVNGSDPEPPFALAIHRSPCQIDWPATAGRTYEVLASDEPAGTYLQLGAVTPTNSPAIWPISNLLFPEDMRLYRVRTAK